MRKSTAPEPVKPESIFSENAAKLVSRVLFFIGAFSLFSYFFHIEYFPSFDLKSAASYVFSLSYVLAVLVISISITFLIPYLMSAAFIRAKPSKRGNQKLLAEIIEWMFYGILSMCAISACIFLSIYLEWPFERGILFGFLTLVLISSIRVRLIKSRRAPKARQITARLWRREVFAIRKPNLVLGAFWATQDAPANAAPRPAPVQRLSRRRFFTRSIGPLMLVVYRRANPSHSRRIWERSIVRRILWTQWLGTLMMGIAQIIPLAILLLILGSASEIKGDDYPSYVMITTEYAMCVAMVGGILLCLALSPVHRKSWYWGLGLVLFLPLVLNLLSQSSGMLPMTVMQITKNGNFRAEKIILSAKTCGNIASLLGVDCDAKSSKPIELCNVHVMTRVGPETYLRLPTLKPDSNGKHRVQRLFIATSDIAAMDINFDLKFLRLKKIDENLNTLSPVCIPELSTLEGDSAFDFDGFTLTKLGKTQLRQFVRSIKASSRDIKEVIITGYADQIGEERHNAWLSARRAAEVRIFMEKELRRAQATIPLVVDSKGSANPIITDCRKAKDRIACEAPNRRVELHIIKKATPAALSVKQ